MHSFIRRHQHQILLWLAIEMYHAVRLRARSRTLYWPTSLYCPLSNFAAFTRDRFDSLLSFWSPTYLASRQALHFGSFCSLRDDLPKRASFCCGLRQSGSHLYFRRSDTLKCVAHHAWQRLVVLWTSIGAAFLFVEFNGAGPELAWWNALKARFAPRPKYHVLPKPRPRAGNGRTEPDDVYASIDPILDKISKFGIGSLTASERRQLNRERERLLKKSQ